MAKAERMGKQSIENEGGADAQADDSMRIDWSLNLNYNTKILSKMNSCLLHHGLYLGRN